jgi:hypothetical protein
MTEITPRDIETTYRHNDWQYAKVTLPDGRSFGAEGRRYRCGQRGNRGYAWRFTLNGPGLAHVVPQDQREATWTTGWYDGPTYVSTNVVRTHCSTMTQAKKHLAALIKLL